MPARNAKGGDLLRVARIDVYRLAEPLSNPLSLTEEEFATRSTLIATLPVRDTDFALKEKTYVDVLSFAGQEARLTYAIRFVNASGQKAAFSNFFLIEPTAKIASEATELIGNVTQQAIKLSWNKPVRNVDGTTPANIIGFNLYRRLKSKPPYKRLNSTPIKTGEYTDIFFSFETEYSYLIRVVSLGRGGQSIESRASEILNVLPKDTFAPNPPDAITIASAPNTISIFFATNVEKDVVKYRIFRTTTPSNPKENWKLITPNGIKTNTYRDTKVESGKTYYYYLVAIDKFDNVSAPSEVVSEEAL